MNPVEENLDRITGDARANIARIAAVPIRQSALDKAKADARAKKLRDEKEAASALEDFVKEFDADVSDEREWRSGGVEGGIKYSSAVGAGARVSMGASRRHFTTAPKEDIPLQSHGKKRNLDSFLEEIKRDQSVRENSRDKHSRHHTETLLSQEPEQAANTLYLACLPLSTRQSQLRDIFSPYGTIRTIKIITEKPSSKDFTRKSQSASIVFEKPSQAERAQVGVDGRYMGQGWRIKASWGDHESRKLKDAPSAPFDAGVPSTALSKGQLSRAPPPTSLLVPANVPKWGQKQELQVRVQRPRDARALRRIHGVIEAVADYGPEFEALLMEREKENEDYAFLFDSNLPDAQYYRWKSYSLRNGDTPYSWRAEPFQMFVDGEWWIPPEQVNVDDEDTRSDPEEEEQRLVNRIKGFLGLSGQKKFLWLLRGVDGRRGSVARGMAYAMDRADAAEEIVDVIIASLCSEETPLQKKIARLYLISDILHNSSSGRTNVWKYRQLFEARLGSVFNHLHSIYASFDGRIKADNFRRQVMAVTSVWEQWLVFNNANVEAWIKTFLGRVEEDRQSQEEKAEEEVVEKPVERKGKWKSVSAKTTDESGIPHGLGAVTLNAPEDSEEDIDGQPMEGEEDVDGKEMEDESIDGKPMDEDEDVDGVPMDEDEDVDGLPMDEEDVDGKPMDEPSPQATTASPVQIPAAAPPSPPQAENPHTAHSPPTETPRPQKRQRMRAADMFND